MIPEQSQEHTTKCGTKHDTKTPKFLLSVIMLYFEPIKTNFCRAQSDNTEGRMPALHAADWGLIPDILVS